MPMLKEHKLKTKRAIWRGCKKIPGSTKELPMHRFDTFCWGCEEVPDDGLAGQCASKRKTKHDFLGSQRSFYFYTLGPDCVYICIYIYVLLRPRRTLWWCKSMFKVWSNFWCHIFFAFVCRNARATLVLGLRALNMPISWTYALRICVWYNDQQMEAWNSNQTRPQYKAQAKQLASF